MKKILTEFKSFINRGNVIDLAVAVILGASFNKIVSSLVNDMIMPLVAVLTGGVDFKDLGFILNTESGLTLAYGLFLQNILDFLIIAASVFVIVKVFERFKQKEVVKTTSELDVLKDILEELRKVKH
jgi:large conductance mechanosensitive channel